MGTSASRARVTGYGSRGAISKEPEVGAAPRAWRQCRPARWQALTITAHCGATSRAAVRRATRSSTAAVVPRTPELSCCGRKSAVLRSPRQIAPVSYLGTLFSMTSRLVHPEGVRPSVAQSRRRPHPCIAREDDRRTRHASQGRHAGRHTSTLAHHEGPKPAGLAPAVQHVCRGSVARECARPASPNVVVRCGRSAPASAPTPFLVLSFPSARPASLPRGARAVPHSLHPSPHFPSWATLLPASAFTNAHVGSSPDINAPGTRRAESSAVHAGHVPPRGI